MKNIGGRFYAKRVMQFEKELLEMKKQGHTHREMGEVSGYSKQQIKEFFCAYNERQRNLEAGIAIPERGRPAKKLSLPKMTDVRIFDKNGRKRCLDQTVGNGKQADAGFSFAHRKDGKAQIKYMVIYRHKRSCTKTGRPGCPQKG